MMSSQKLLGALRLRVPFFLARRLLAENGFPRGHSWDDIIDKTKEPAELRKADWASLGSAYNETIVATEKLLRIYPVSSDAMATLRTAVTSLQLDTSDAAVKAYPFLLTETEKTNAQYAAPKLVAVEQFADATALIFSAVRTRVVTESIPTTALAAGVGERYERLVGYVAINKQYFDVALVPHNVDAVYVLTEYLDLVAMERLNAQAATRIAFNAALGKDYLQHPLNLHPAVTRLYNTGDGRVFDLGSMTDTSMEKHEKMHAGGTDVRADPGHQAAIEAGVGFAAFGIGKEWQLPNPTGHAVSPTLIVAGPAKIAFEAEPRIEEAYIRKCAHYDELTFVMDNLLDALKED